MSPPMAHRRVADVLFRRDMVGPSLSSLAASMTGLLLVEKLALDLALPPLVPLLESCLRAYGLFAFAWIASLLQFTLAFWGTGTLMALPALLGVTRWKIQEEKQLDVRTLLRSMPLICLNFAISVVIVPPILCTVLPRASFDFRALPDMKTLLRDVTVWITVEEVMFFYGHRWLHTNKRMYAAVHKIHHTWTAPISFVAIYSHPLEHVMCNIAPLVAGPVLCGSHIAAFAVFIFLGLAHTQAVHSGYWFCDDNGMHDEHHAKFNVNYGVLGVLDAWHGTYRLPAGAAGAGPSSLAGTGTPRKVE